MADLNPGEVLERFREDLDRVHQVEDSCGTIEADALNAASAASEFAESAKSIMDSATRDTESVVKPALAAIEEAAGRNPSSDEAIRAIMSVKGKTDEEIEAHFEHFEATSEEEQPVIVIGGSEKGLGLEGLISVTYGRTATKNEIRSFLKTYTGHGTHVDSRKRGLGERYIGILAKSQRAFSVSTSDEYPIDLFADQPTAERFSLISANSNMAAHPFEEIHFAGNAVEVRDMTESIVGAYRKPSVADAMAVQSLGLPTMVAYGEDAVLELSARIGETNPQSRILARRCIEGLGIDMEYIADELPDEDIPNLSEKIVSDFGNHLFVKFDEALTEFLRHGGTPAADHIRTLAFLAPMQKAIGYAPPTVLDKMVGELSSQINVNYSFVEGVEVTVAAVKPLSPTEASETKSVKSELEKLMDRMEELGIAYVPKDGLDMEMLARRVERPAVRKELANTSKIHFAKRDDLKVCVRALTQEDQN